MAAPQKVITIRTPPALDARIRAIARKENNHIGPVIRRLLSQALDREDRTTRPGRPERTTDEA